LTTVTISNTYLSEVSLVHLSKMDEIFHPQKFSLVFINFNLYEHHIPTFTLPTLPSPRQFGMNPRFVQKLPLQFRQYRQVPFLGNRPPLRMRGGPPKKDKLYTVYS
jgi:hypothetical protein